MTLLLVATLSLTYSDYSHISASQNNDNEDFEDQNLIQICCAWEKNFKMGF